MKFYAHGPAGLVASLALLTGAVTGCGGSSAGEAAAGPGMTDLAPSYSAEPKPAKKDRPDARKARERDDAEPRGQRSEKPREAAGSEPPAAPKTRRPQPRQEKAVAADPGPVTVTDPSGDLTASLDGTPPSADIVAVRLDRTGDTVEVRTTFAGEVPTRMSGDQGMNVASFYDVDGNGIVDYEIWASLADNGWGTGHLDRRQRESSFGPSTGIEVSVEGDTLVTRFPLDRIGGVDEFRWSAASEHGSYESMAASTTARDYAPDDGAAAYPG